MKTNTDVGQNERMIASLLQLFSTRGFMPHGHCYLWRPEIVATHVVSDLVIALAYWSIPFSLFYIMRHRRDVPVRWLMGLFAIFIASCGVTHLMEVITVWHPIYVTSGLIKVFTAVVSGLTAIVLVPVLPKLVNLRSPQELELLNQKLAQEVEERLAIEQELRRSHATLEAIVKASPLSIVAVDQLGKVTLWNPAAELLFGWSKAEVAGQPVPHIPDEERTLFEQTLDQELRGTWFRELETRRRTKTGETIDVALWTGPLVVDGEIVGGLRILSDITERKKLERQREEMSELLETHVAERTAELEQANRELTERNQENELFVYSVSHDLRSPLVNLQGFSDELRRSCRQIQEELADARVPEDVRQRAGTILDSDVNEAVHYIQTAVTSLSDILMSLLKLSRAGRAQYHPQELEMGELLADLLKGHEAEFRRRNATHSLAVRSVAWADPAAVEQVFAQLVANGLRYSRPDTLPRIEIGELPQGQEPGSHVDGRRYITYYVRDNGLGIPAELQPKVFQAFQRLHPKATAGEGIGLALSRRMVERNGGKIWFESEPGIGSTFYVSLPVPPNPKPPLSSD